MSIVDFIAVVSFGLTPALVSDIPLAKIIINHKNNRPSLQTERLFLIN